MLTFETKNFNSCLACLDASCDLLYAKYLISQACPYGVNMAELIFVEFKEKSKDKGFTVK